MKLFGHRDVAFVWRRKGEAFNPQKTAPTVKHGRASIMLWGCFSASGPGNLVKVDGIMKKEQYIKILEQNIKQSADKLRLGEQWRFQQDNDPKHTAKLVKAWFLKNDVSILEWPSQSPDLNPIKNLRRELKKRVMARKPSNIKNLETFAKEEWAKIPVDRGAYAGGAGGAAAPPALFQGGAGGQAVPFETELLQMRNTLSNLIVILSSSFLLREAASRKSSLLSIHNQ